MAIPAIFPFPIRQVPTWVIINADDPISLPLMGQFNTDLTWVGGKPIWAKRPSIAGGQQWLQHVGSTPLELSFVFHGISNDVLDFYPSIAWNRLQELARRDDSLGRPPLVWLLHGLTLVQGYITGYDDPQIQYWQHDNLLTQRFIREIGPVKVTMSVIPGDEYKVALSTSYALHAGSETLFEEIAKNKFGDAMYSMALREYNQGAVEGGQVEIPRKQNSNMTKTVSVSPFFDTSDAILGL